MGSSNIGARFNTLGSKQETEDGDYSSTVGGGGSIASNKILKSM